MNNLSEDILMRYLTGECSDKDFARVNAWIKESDDNARRLFRMEEVYHLGRHDSFPDQKKVARAEARLYKKLAQEDAHSRKVIRMHQWMRYAAIIVLALMIGTGGGYLYYQADPTRNMITASSTDGKVKEVMLPDGTKVWLNQSATLRYPKEFSESERDVYLDVEAYFEVTKNRRCPFVVESEAMRIKVLGTTFNFKCDKSHKLAEATLIEGEIEVRGNHDEGMIILSPGQKAELNKTTRRLVVKQVDAKLDAVWHNDLIPFEQADIFVITRTLERFYDVKIILSPDIKSDKTYSGVLKKKDNIESVLQSLDNSIPINYKIVGDNIFISSRNK